MAKLETVVLAHDAPSGFHYDWMVRSPLSPTLCTWRVMTHPRHWTTAGRIELHRLAEHRLKYLRYEGPIGSGRGRVLRIDAGEAVVRQWSADRIVLAVRMKHFTGIVTLGPAKAGETTWGEVSTMDEG